MRRVGAVVLVTIAICMAAAGCGKPKTVQLIMGTGGTSGSYYPLGGALAQLISSKASGISVTAQSTGGGVENLKLVEKGENELALTQNDLADAAMKGAEMFQPTKYVKARAIVTLYPECIQIAARGDSGINSIYDFRGKRISVGAPGSGSEANARQILGTLGIKYEDFSPAFLSNTQTADQMKDRQIDGMFLTTGIPSPALMDISTLHSIKMISLSEADRDKVIAAYPFFSKLTMDANVYKGQTEPVQTLSVFAMLIASADLPDDVVYKITKVIWENQQDLIAVNAKFKYMDHKDPVKGVTIPVHPGAKKYYAEKGIKIE